MHIKWIEVLRRALATKIRMSLLSAAALICLNANGNANDWNTAVSGEFVDTSNGTTSIFSDIAGGGAVTHTYAPANNKSIQIGSNATNTGFYGKYGEVAKIIAGAAGDVETGNFIVTIGGTGQNYYADITNKGDPSTITGGEGYATEIKIYSTGNNELYIGGATVRGTGAENTTDSGGKGEVKGAIVLSGANNTLEVRKKGVIEIANTENITLIASGTNAIINRNFITAGKIIVGDNVLNTVWNINKDNTLENTGVITLLNTNTVNINNTIVGTGGIIRLFGTNNTVNITNSTFKGMLNIAGVSTLTLSNGTLANLQVAGAIAVTTAGGAISTINEIKINSGATLTINAAVANPLTVSKINNDGTLNANFADINLTKNGIITNEGIADIRKLTIDNTGTINGKSSATIGTLDFGTKGGTFVNNLSAVGAALPTLTIVNLDVEEKTIAINGSGNSTTAITNATINKKDDGTNSILEIGCTNIEIGILTVGVHGGEIKGTGSQKIDIATANINGDFKISGSRDVGRIGVVNTTTNILETVGAVNSSVTITNDTDNKKVDLGNVTVAATKTLNLTTTKSSAVFVVNNMTFGNAGNSANFSIGTASTLEAFGNINFSNVGNLNIAGALKLSGANLGSDDSDSRSINRLIISAGNNVISGQQIKITKTDFVGAVGDNTAKLIVRDEDWNLGAVTVSGNNNTITVVNVGGDKKTLTFNGLTVNSGADIKLDNGIYNLGTAGITNVYGKLEITNDATVTFPTLNLSGSLSARDTTLITDLTIDGATLNNGVDIVDGAKITKSILTGALTVDKGKWNLGEVLANGNSLIRVNTINGLKMDKLNVTRGITFNRGLVNVTGDVTNSSGATMTFTGGKNGGVNDSSKLKITGNFTNNGNLVFDLANAKKTDPVMLDASASTTAITFGNNATIKLTGGLNNNEYKLISDKNGTNHGTVIGLINANNERESGVRGSFTHYVGTGVDYSILGSGYIYSVSATVNLDAMHTLITDALKASDANNGIANKLNDIAANDSERRKINDVYIALDKVFEDPIATGRAVSELNNTNSTTAIMGMGKNAAHQINSAIAQVFSENRGGKIAAGLVNAPQKDRDEKSSSAGGLPSRQYSAIDGKYQWSGFIKAYGGFGAQANSHTASGYDFGGVGVAAGIDRTIADNLKLGGLFGYSYNNTTLSQNFGEATDKVLRGGLYANFDWDKFFLNVAPSIAMHVIESKRYIDSMNAIAQGDRTGMDFNFYTQLGYNVELPNNFILTPSFAFSATCLHDPSYTEKGAGGANLSVSSLTNWSLLQSLELKLSKIWQVNEKLIILPEVWFAWEHEYAYTNEVTVNFSALPSQMWNTPVKQATANRAAFGVGVSTLLSNKYEIFGRWDQKLWDGGYNTAFTVGVGVKF